MKTKQEVKERIEQIESEIKYQDGANLYWQKGQLDSLQWMLQGESHEKRETPFKACPISRILLYACESCQPKHPNV